MLPFPDPILALAPAEAEIPKDVEPIAVDAEVLTAKPILTKTQERRFERFWAVYPKHVNRGQAERAWLKLNPGDALTEQIVGAVKQQARIAWDDRQFIPYPASWLNGKRWLDEVEPRPTPHQPQLHRELPRAQAAALEDARRMAEREANNHRKEQR